MHIDSARAALRQGFRTAHERIAVASVRYALGVVCEDVIVNGILKAEPPLALSSWRGRTGLTELPPLRCGIGRLRWAQRVGIDALHLRAYAWAVYGATDTYFVGLADVPLHDPEAAVLRALLFSLSSASPPAE
jgi:hypothetical protein